MCLSRRVNVRIKEKGKVIMNLTMKMLSSVAVAVVYTLSSAQAANTWTGSFDSDFNTGANYVGDSWSEWSDYVFDSNAVNPAMNVDAFTGWGNISLNRGLTTNIVIGGSQPIVMAPARFGESGWEVPSLGGTIAIASDSKNLTVNTSFRLSGTLNMNVGAGRTLTANGAVNWWSDMVGTAAAINKQGSGTTVLAGANNYNGTTTISAGTLVAASSTALGVGGWSATSWTLLTSGATLALQGNIRLDEHMHVVGAGVDGLGALRSLSGNNALTMTYGNSGSGPGFALDDDTTVGVDADTLMVTGFYHDSGSYGITKVGNGTLVLSQTNTYTGSTTVNAGTLRLGTPLLTDNFTATGNPDPANVNYNLANRQTGSAATQSWTKDGNAQVGNATDVQQPTGTGGDYLLLAFGASAKLEGMPLSSATVAGPLKITFDMFKGNTTDPNKWTSFAMSSTGSAWPIAGSGEFGFLYRNNTGIQIFNNGALMQNFDSTTGGDSFGFYLADADGTGSPFAGNGTRIIVTQGGSVLGTYALDTGMGTSYLAFGTDGGSTPGMIGGVDNLVVSPQRTNILDPSTPVALTTAGATLELDNVLQTVAGLEGVAGTSVAMGPLSSLTVHGNTDSTFSGDISGLLASLTKSGTGLLTLSGTNTYTGTTTVSNGTLRIDGDSSGATGALTVETGARLGGNGSYGGDITLNDGAALNCALNLTNCTLTCGGQLNFTNLDFDACSFTIDAGVTHRAFTLIEAASLGTVTFANAEGKVNGVSSKLYISGNKLMINVGRGTIIRFF